MRTLILAGLLAVPCGCAHHEPRNLAQRQPATTPRGDFQSPHNPRRDPPKRVAPPIVTPPVP